jgi:hypothetical protein
VKVVKGRSKKFTGLIKICDASPIDAMQRRAKLLVEYPPPRRTAKQQEDARARSKRQ